MWTILAVVLAGCGSHKINYRGPAADLTYTGKRSLTVGVLDKRPYILNQEKPPNYVGTIRGGYGNPFNQTTESGNPLADDFRDTLAESLTTGGFSVTPLPLNPQDTSKTARKAFRASGGERFLLLTLDEWQNDYYPASYGNENTYILFNVTLRVYNRTGKVLAKKSLSGENNLPSGWPNKTVPVFYQKKVTELINAPNISRALR